MPHRILGLGMGMKSRDRVKIGCMILVTFKCPRYGYELIYVQIVAAK
jgi:hypothetical protein